MTVQNLEKGKEYCEKNFFRICCPDCPYRTECRKIESLYTKKTIINGVSYGAFFLQDLSSRILRNLKFDGYLTS